MSLIQPEPVRIQNFEDVLQKTGWGTYYKYVLGFSSAAAFSNAIAFMSISFAIPLSKSGRAIGGLFLCTASDIYGKRCLISKSLLIIFGSSFLIAFTHNPFTLYLAAFFLGSGIEASTLTVRIYLAELLPKSKRGFYMVIPNIFWSLGYLVTALFTCFLTTNHSLEPRGLGVKLTNWRVMFAVSGGINIIVACCSASLEISPRYFLLRKRYEAALKVLKQFYAINKSKYSETFELRGYHLINLISNYDVNLELNPQNCFQRITFHFRKLFQVIRLLIGKRFINTVLLFIWLKMPMLFGILGSNILLSKFLQYERNSNCIIYGTDLLHVNITKTDNCEFFIKNNNLYRDLLIISLNIFVGQIILLFLIDRIGRKIPIFAGLLTCGVTSFILAYLENVELKSVISSLFLMAYSLVDSAISVIIVESFPTVLRGTASANIGFYPLIVLCFVYLYLNMPCQNISIIIGAYMLATAVFVYFIIDLKGCPMVE